MSNSSNNQIGGSSEDDEAREPGAAEERPQQKVGYKRPPTGSRWKPGQSGNPKGRPIGAKSMATVLGEELDKPIEARIGGRLVNMTRRRAMVQKQVELALKGDTRAFVVLLKLDPTMAKELAAADKTESQDKLSPEEQQVFRAFMDRGKQDLSGAGS